MLVILSRNFSITKMNPLKESWHNLAALIYQKQGFLFRSHRKPEFKGLKRQQARNDQVGSVPKKVLHTTF